MAVGLAGEEVQSRLEIHSGLCWAAGRGLGRGPRGSLASGVRSGASGDIRRDRDAGRGRGPRGGRGRRCGGAVPGGRDRDVRVFMGTIRQLTYSYLRFTDDGSAAQEGHPAGCLPSQDMDPEPWPLEVTPPPLSRLTVEKSNAQAVNGGILGGWHLPVSPAWSSLRAASGFSSGPSPCAALAVLLVQGPRPPRDGGRQLSSAAHNARKDLEKSFNRSA